MRQVDAGALHHAPARPDRRRDHLRRSRHHEAEPGRDAPSAARDDDGLPGPVREPEPAQARRLHRRRGPPGAQGRHRRRDQAARPGAARDRRPEPGALQPVPARVLGRTAPADRRRARARRQPEADRLRRAGLRTRRLGAGADPQPAQGPPVGVRSHLHLHRARPQRRAPHLRPGDGHVSRPHRRERPPAGALPRAEAPVHGRTALGGADPEPCARPQAAADRARGRRPESDQPAGGVPVPPALPAVRRGHLRRATSPSSGRSATTRAPRVTSRSNAGR